MPLFPLLWLFFCYSFLGWVLETAVSAVRLHRYVDRSVLFGPLCACYGITAVLPVSYTHLDVYKRQPQDRADTER